VRLTIVAVGKIKEKPMRQVADEYLGRVRHYVRCDEIETRDGEGLARAAPADALLVALEVDGAPLTSEQLARKIDGFARVGKGNVAFLIGGAEGIPPTISARAEFRLSLSSLTLPHRLARVVLFEQLYRAMTILRGEPYAREG
jgi:23S rRNA (pseudouridine1915-N3)-methyltransferase